MKYIWNQIKYYVEETISDFRIVWGIYPNVLLITVLTLLFAYLIL